MGSPCRVEALIGIGLFLGVSGMVAAAPPLGISSGLFDSSQPRTQGLAKLKIEETILYKATARTHKFCHHPNLVRQGQRVVFDLDEQGLATQLRLGSEVDLGTPDWITAVGGDA